MGVKSRKKKKLREHPTIFAMDGSIRHYDDGTLFSLYTQISLDEWKHIIGETVKYKVFITCLKDVACPILDEIWTKEDDWWRVQLDRTIQEMRKLTPLEFIGIDEEKLTESYTLSMRANANTLSEEIQRLKSLDALRDSITNVSEL